LRRAKLHHYKIPFDCKLTKPNQIHPYSLLNNLCRLLHRSYSQVF
jgi:hypothetical protein